MDVLPVQASAVSCERVFSSSKETCALRRSRLSPPVLSALQILKYSFKSSRLSFTTDLVANEADYGLNGPISEAAILELIDTADLETLHSLLSNSSAS
jgi:hAT family C-terminal dimerisation region